MAKIFLAIASLDNSLKQKLMRILFWSFSIGGYVLMSNKLRRFQHGALVFMLIATAFFNSYVAVFSQMSQEGWNNGIRRSADDGNSWAKSNVLVTKQINLNELAIGRINEARRAANKVLLDKSIAVNIGQEVSVNDYNVFLGRYEDASSEEEIKNSVISSCDLPISVDNSKLDCFPPIRDQKPLGSCASFSTTYYAMTHMTALIRGWNEKDDKDNSIKFSPKWTYNIANGGNDEGTSIYGVYQIMSEIGVATWEDVPYDSNYSEWTLDKDIWIRALNNKVDKFGVIKNLDTDTGLNNLKMMLTNGYVLNFITGLDSWKFSSVKDDPSDSLDDTYTGSGICYLADGKLGPHAMTIVGYNDSLWVDINNNGSVDDGEKGALKVANSWGTDWQDNGFSWIAYDALKNVSAVSGSPVTDREQVIIGGQATWLTAKNDYKPKLLAELTVSHTKRNQMTVSLGYSDITRTIPDKFLNNIFSNRGGELCFNGTWDSVKATFIFDYTDLVDSDALSMNGKKRWYIKAGDSKKDGHALMIHDFRLINPNTNEVVSLDIGSSVAIDGENHMLWIDYGFLEKASVINIANSRNYGDFHQVFAISINQTDNKISVSEYVYALVQRDIENGGRTFMDTQWDNVRMAKVYKPVRPPT